MDESGQMERESQSFLHNGLSERQAETGFRSRSIITAASLAFFIFSYALMGAYILQGWVAGDGCYRPLAGNEGMSDYSPDCAHLEFFVLRRFDSYRNLYRFTDPVRKAQISTSRLP